MTTVSAVMAGPKKDKLVGYKVVTKDDSFIVPVMDSRRPEDVDRIKSLEKSINETKGSKFFKPGYSVRGLRY